MKPSIPKGTRDFSPQEMVKRSYILDTIRGVFRLYGYLPIETTSIENLDTLLGKYGEEGDRLIFKILNSGDFLADVKNSDLNNISSKELARSISEKALRYDLTVPFARYVVMNRNDITFPFKRYQIQPVWRADRPQKGRYREFYQCDADVIGSTSLLNEVELIKMIDDVFTKLNIPVVIKINNRKILQGIADKMGASERMTEFAAIIDKVDKIGMIGVDEALKKSGFNEPQRAVFRSHLHKKGTQSGIQDLRDIKNDAAYFNSKIMADGINEIEHIITFFGEYEGLVEFDFSLARGLNYYTGTIIEVKVDSSKCNSQFTSSIAGGGRYDDLTGLFGLPGISGVGISFGADRIYDVLEELNLFPDGLSVSTQVMFVNFGDAQAKSCLEWIDQLRKAGISTELYPDDAKFKKQMNYADAKKIAYVVFAGEVELNKGVVKIRNMASGVENEIALNKMVEYFSKILKTK